MYFGYLKKWFEVKISQNVSPFKIRNVCCVFTVAEIFKCFVFDLPCLFILRSFGQEWKQRSGNTLLCSTGEILTLLKNKPKIWWVSGIVALAPMEPDCVTLAPTSKEIIKTWGNCVTLCRAITKVKVQTRRVGKRWLWVSQEFKRKSTEIEKLKKRKQNGDSVKSIICCRENGSLTRRKPLGVLL